MKKGVGLKIFIFVCLFVVALFVLFPINNLRGYIFDRVFKASRVLLVSDSMHFSLLGMPGLRMDNVNVTLPMGDQELDLWSKAVTLKFALSGFLPPLPGVAVNISELKKGGDIYTKVGKGSNTISFYLDVEKLNLEQIGARNGNPPLKGYVDISSDIFFDESQMDKSSGYFNLSIGDFSINQQSISPPELGGLSIVIPAMKLGKLEGVLKMKNGVLEMNKFKFGEDPSSDLKGTATGDFKVEKTFEQSYLNIALKLTLSQKVLDNPEASTFKSTLTGFQTAAGEYSLKCSGTIQDFINSPLYPCKKADL
ncbi:MAG: type II secretion system protein GspN [Proteobacteria bacterium]|nr:type II secretion system protein GspN [Pseudomonadota bacterium]NBY19039.1 type II secretion system protein GspN [bacterium]